MICLLVGSEMVCATPTHGRTSNTDERATMERVICNRRNRITGTLQKSYKCHSIRLIRLKQSQFLTKDAVSPMPAELLEEPLVDESPKTSQRYSPKTDVPTLGRAAQGGKMSWITAIFMVAFHIGAIAALFFFSWQAVLAAAVLYMFAINMGIGMGYHRLL